MLYETVYRHAYVSYSAPMQCIRHIFKIMDNKKDINKYDVLSLVSKHQIELISKDNNAIFAYKKTERFSTAIYLVSNLMSDNEPLKWELRSRAMSLMPIASGLVAGPVSDKFEAIKKLRVVLIEIISLFEVAFKSQLMSEMNFRLLRKELTVFIVEISKPSLELETTGVAFESNFFAVSTDSSGQIASSLDEINQTKRSIIKDKIKAAINLSDSMLSSSVISARVEVKNSRKEAILKIFREKNSPLMIKDLSYVIKDCSEKTIQRELLSLVASGVLNKEGERRWSRYALAIR